jgi:hypothetical protein
MVEKATTNYSVRPGISTPIELKTLPDAICTLQEEEPQPEFTMYR